MPFDVLYGFSSFLNTSTVDDVEDLNSVKTMESRDKTYSWLTGEIIPLGDRNTKIAIVGNLLHEDSLLMRLKQTIEKGDIKAVFKEYPLIGGDGKILWLGKYPTLKDIEEEKKRETVHLLHFLAYPYLLGAKIQLARYRQETNKLNKQSASIGIMACLHESSCLFEDIVTVLTYLGKCGLSHRMDLLLIDIRNHIRHDIRDNFDEEEDARKKPRLERLGIKANLQTDLEFSFEFIKVGNKIIYLNDIDSYIAWAESNINKVLIDARERGFLRKE